MPSGDETGPEGRGPMTGRKMGYCVGYDVPGFMNRDFGKGFKRRGFGQRPRLMQMGRQIMQPRPTVVTEKQEKQILEKELDELKQEIKEIENRLKELKK